MKKWQVKTAPKEIVDSLIQETGLPPFICRILAGRGILSRADAELFFNSEELSDPFLLADMQKAVDTINEFIESGEKITVYGDYDCDGVTSTYMLFSYLEAQGADVDWYIPSRDEGYGLNNDAIDLLHKRGTKLIITVDNGISAVEEAAHISELGMTLVITDHHQVPDVLPQAAAIVNPHRKDDMSPFHKIAGCGVVLKLIAAMEGGDSAMAVEEYSAFAAVGTVADIVPLVDENRFIVRQGLDALYCTDNTGLRALARQCGI
ncbi:MAG: DHH family phosphoesterase [Oscillospiraceae bacterium]|nr:DHH family phosphoesterase [Oscillospiraceae bacterium]